MSKSKLMTKRKKEDQKAKDKVSDKEKEKEKINSTRESKKTKLLKNNLR